MSLFELRELAGKTQVEVADARQRTQSQLSKPVPLLGSSFRIKDAHCGASRGGRRGPAMRMALSEGTAAPSNLATYSDPEL
jgi:hypothetical protein